MRIMFVDPSGSFNEGKGHTGICTINYNIDKNELDFDSMNVVSIAANNFKTRHDYWEAVITHANFIDLVIIESFMIRTQGFLMGKMPETIQFIGAFSYVLESKHIMYVLQTPTQAKSRFKDEALPRYIPHLELRPNGRYYFNGGQINDHIRDAMKHLLYFNKYGYLKCDLSRFKDEKDKES